MLLGRGHDTLVITIKLLITNIIYITLFVFMFVTKKTINCSWQLEIVLDNRIMAFLSLKSRF